MALGWAIIGAGMHPQQKLAPAIGVTPDAELIAVLSRDQGRADTFAENHGAKVGYSDIGDLLGAHMIGAEVTELLGELAMTRLLEGTTAELGWAVHPHPTISEVVKEAALAAEGEAIHI